MILSFINIHKVPQEAFALGFQYFPQDRAYVQINEWKIMFDPSVDSDYIDLIVIRSLEKLSLFCIMITYPCNIDPLTPNIYIYM